MFDVQESHVPKFRFKVKPTPVPPHRPLAFDSSEENAIMHSIEAGHVMRDVATLTEVRSFVEVLTMF
jgi:hypothetical protein